LKYY